MKLTGGRVLKVVPGGIGEELGIEAGDIIARINGERVNDTIAYQFLCADENVEVEVLKKDGNVILFDIEKDFDECLGLEFANAIFDREKSCANRCVFCFIDQMPPGLRSSLYVKDDDYRLSFWHGNFITFTNIGEADIARMAQMRLSPLYVSVHTTNPELRRQMLGNRRAGKIMQQLKTLVEAGIDIHAQVVLCPGWNDGQELARTIEDLASLGPNIVSVGIVPVGLTGYRKGLSVLRSFALSEAINLISWCRKRQRMFRASRQKCFIYLADEFYLMAGKRIPARRGYDGFPQIENGIGLVRLFTDSFKRNLKKIPCHTNLPQVVAVATGTAAAPVLQELCGKINIDGLDVKIYPVQNRYFGGHVNVVGLLTGHDLLAQLKGKELGNKLILPSVMCKCDEPIFLDGMSVEELSKKLAVDIKVVPVEEGAGPFIKEILG